MKLPKDFRKVARLRMKLNEYKARFEPFGDSEFQIDIDTFFKIMILENLLQDEKIKALVVFKKITLQLRNFDERVFWNAWGVISDYCLTGGKNAQGGNGLPGHSQ